MQPPPTSPFLSRFRFAPLAVVAFATALACGSPGPAPARRPGAPPAPEVVPPPRPTGVWSIKRNPGTARYEILNSATIELAGDTMPGDSLVTALTMSVVLADSADVLSVTGTIDSVQVARGARIMTSESTPPLPIVLRAALDRQGGMIDQSNPGVTTDSTGSFCASSLDPLIAMTRDAFVRLPERLTSGSVWHDTTRATSCRGRIPVTTTTIATYTVRGETPVGGHTLLSVDRSVTLSLIGGGEQHGRSASVQGQGTGGGTLLIDPETGALVEGRSTSTVTVTFEAGMLRQIFTQHGRQEIRRR